MTASPDAPATARAVLPMDHISLAVIGMPGHGKSTFLNAMVNKRGQFAVGSGGASCTQEVDAKEFELEVDGAKVNAKLVDTMGFPDPDPKKARMHYDSVIECCNQPLNMIVWVVRCERELHSLVELHKVLMREFNNANPPIIMVVNGTESYEDEDERKERKADDARSSILFGKEVAEAAGIHVLKVIPGAEKSDLKSACRELGFQLVGTEPKSSTMKTFTQLEEEMEAYKDVQDESKLADVELRKMREKNDKVRKYIQDLKARKLALEEKMRNKGGYIPFVGRFAREHFTPLIEQIENDIQRWNDVLGEGEVEHSSRRDRLVQAAQEIFRGFKRLAEALMVPLPEARL